MAHVPCEPHAERAAEECQRAERRRSDAIVIFRELITSAQIKSSIYAPDIGFLQLCRAISGPIGQENDIFFHFVLHSLDSVHSTKLAISSWNVPRCCSLRHVKAELSRTNPPPHRFPTNCSPPAL